MDRSLLSPPGMQPILFESDSGLPSLRFGAETLEDPVDPVLAAEMFAGPETVDRTDHVVLFGAGLGYRVRRLRELGRDPIVFEPCRAALDLAQQHGPGVDGASVFTDLAALHEHLLAVSKPDQSTILLHAPPYGRAFPDALSAVSRVIDEVQGLVMLRRNSVQERAAFLTERALENLPRLSQVPSIASLGGVLDGVPAFIVSAGPSLDRNRHLLAEASKRGPVFAVNTSAPVLAAIDAPIDLLVAIEALDVSEPMKKAAHVTRALALDLTSGGPNFEVEVDRKVCFLASAAQYRALGEALGVGTLGYGGSVATAAFALAAALGADPIVVLGQDLAYTDGRGYASDTLFEGTVVRREGPFLHIDRVAKWDEMTRAGGLKVPSKTRPAVDVPAWGGGTVWSTHELVLFRRWFEMAARELRGVRRLVNATEGGASIEGFEEVALEALLAELPEREHGLHAAIDAAPLVPKARIQEVAREAERSAKKLATAATKVVKGLRRGHVAAARKASEQVRAAAKASPLAESHVAPALMEIMADDTLAPAERERRTYAAIERSAKKVASLAKRASRG